MKKKFILLTVIVTYLTFIFSAPIGLAISSDIAFEVGEPEIDEPIKPSESKEITFKVKYRLEVDNLAKRFYLNRRIGRMFAFGFFKLYFFKWIKQIPPVNLSLSVKSPEWCQVELDNYVVEFDYDNVYQEKEVKLTFSLDENAPALQRGDIEIEAIFSGEKGSIEAASNSTNISFISDYISNISIEADTNFTIPPLKETMIPINISNNGNGESIVNIAGYEKEKWNITPDQESITIDVNGKKQIMISITPPKKFNNESITFTFNPISTVEGVDDNLRQGTSVDFSITFYNDGSLKEDDDIDITSVIIISFVIIIIIIVVFILLRRR